MDKQMIINRLADICYRPKIKDDEDFAIQLFIEALVLPKGVKHYTMAEMKQYLENFLQDIEFGESK